MQQKRSGQLADAVTSVWCATWPRPLAATNRPGQSVRRAPFGLCPPVAARENKAERTVVTVRHITFSHTQAHVILGRLPHIYFGHGCNPASNRLIGQPSLDLIFFPFKDQQSRRGLRGNDIIVTSLTPHGTTLA
jgi:hypothetical protein